MIAQRQLPRMRIQVGLILQIAGIVPPDMVPQQRDRHDKRDDAAAMIFDGG
jgi:hypothetical protein